MADYPKPTDIGTVLRRIRAGHSAKLDKRKALADLGYGSEKNVDKEVDAADDYRKENKLPPLNMGPILVKPSDNPASGSHFSPSKNLIKNRTEQSIAKPSRLNGYLGGEIESPVDILGHEMTHVMTDPDWKRVEAYGRARPRRWGSYKDTDYVPVQGDGRKLTNEELNKERVAYPEYNPLEFAPPLAAMTRLEYQLTGKRVDTPEKFDKKVAEYDAMSSKEKLAFKKEVSAEVARFYNYLDIVSDPEAKDIRLWGTEGDKKTPTRLEGKDRRKRFLDISREMIPSLVEKEDSFEESVSRRMS